MDNGTLYDQIGGAKTIDSLIDQFYEKVLADESLAPFFQNTSMEKLREMQKEFFSIALDGPVTRSDISLFAAHANRGIRREHLTRFTEHLLDTLKETGVDDDAASAIVARIATYSNEILGESIEDG